MTPCDLHQHLIPLAALYPEIHYRFKAFPFSRYFLRQPEIIADAPSRLEPGHPLPILLLIKDGDQFPVILEGVNVEAQSGDQYFRRHISFGREIVSNRWWHHLAWVNLPVTDGIWEINVTWRLQIGDRHYNVKNDNLPGLSHRPLSVRYSGAHLLRREGWIFGDFHAHTAYTEDQVEFGAPLAIYPILGEAAGLSFALPADHSYDLDDLPGSFTETDPALARFRFRSTEIDRLNREHQGKFCLLHGYELSVANSRRKNVHLLLANQRDFLPGSGDSAEKWFQTDAELTIERALGRMQNNALAFAAHPMMKPPLLQRWLLGRGSWGKADLQNEKIQGLQVWNGAETKDFDRGLRTWIKGLLTGKRWKLVAGSDTHGNFNRYRQVHFPMLKLKEANTQVFGEVRTGIHLSGELTPVNILNALMTGRSLITDGPFADLQWHPGSEGGKQALIEAKSTKEFGSLAKIRLLWGAVGQKNERLLWEKAPREEYSFSSRESSNESSGYLRLEVLTASGRRAFTNPVFSDGR